MKNSNLKYGIFKYEINENDEVVITSCDGDEEKDVTIPPEININGMDRPVTRIGDDAFEGCSNLQITSKE